MPNSSKNLHRMAFRLMPTPSLPTQWLFFVGRTPRQAPLGTIRYLHRTRRHVYGFSRVAHLQNSSIDRAGRSPLDPHSEQNPLNGERLSTSRLGMYGCRVHDETHSQLLRQREDASGTHETLPTMSLTRKGTSVAGSIDASSIMPDDPEDCTGVRRGVSSSEGGQENTLRGQQESCSHSTTACFSSSFFQSFQEVQLGHD